MFDPLDRPIPDEENDESIKRTELIQMLNDMPAILGFALNAPMSKERSALLERMFETEVQVCNEIGQQYLDKAQEQGLNFTDDIAAHEKIVGIGKVHKFFEAYKLVENADVMQSRFEHLVKKNQQLINLHKNFKKSSEVGQHVMHFIRDIFRRKVEKNYPILTKLLIDLYRFIRECKDEGPGRILLNDKDKQRDILKHFEDAEMNIEDTCRDLV